MLTTILQKGMSFVDLIAIGIIILLVGLAIGLLLNKIAKRVLNELDFNKVMIKVGITADMEGIIGSLVAFIIYVITVILFLNWFGVTSIVFYLIILGISILIILAIIMKIKDILPNWYAGMNLRREKGFIEGKNIEINMVIGKIERVGKFETILRTGEDDLLYIPNAFFVKYKYKIKN